MGDPPHGLGDIVRDVVTHRAGKVIGCSHASGHFRVLFDDGSCERREGCDFQLVQVASSLPGIASGRTRAHFRRTEYDAQTPSAHSQSTSSRCTDRYPESGGMEHHAQNRQSLNAYVHEKQCLKQRVSQGTFSYAKGACVTSAPVYCADVKTNIAASTCANCLKALHHDSSNRYLQLLQTTGCIKVTEAKAVQTCDISEGDKGMCGHEGNRGDAVKLQDQLKAEPWADQKCKLGDERVIQTMPEGFDAHNYDAQRTDDHEKVDEAASEGGISTLSGIVEPCEAHHCSEDSPKKGVRRVTPHPSHYNQTGVSHYAKREGGTTTRRPTPHPSCAIINPEQGKPEKTTFLQTLSQLLYQGRNRLQNMTQRKPKD